MSAFTRVALFHVAFTKSVVIINSFSCKYQTFYVFVFSVTEYRAGENSFPVKASNFS